MDDPELGKQHAFSRDASWLIPGYVLCGRLALTLTLTLTLALTLTLLALSLLALTLARTLVAHPRLRAVRQASPNPKSNPNSNPSPNSSPNPHGSNPLGSNLLTL